MSVSTIIRIYCPKYHINLIYENNKNCRKSILPYPISFEILNIYKIVQFWCYETFSPLWFEPGSGHMWESQVLLTDGQVVFLRVLRFSPTFDERSARYKWNILERAVKPKSEKKKKKKKNVTRHLWPTRPLNVVPETRQGPVPLYMVQLTKKGHACAILK